MYILSVKHLHILHWFTIQLIINFKTCNDNVLIIVYCFNITTRYWLYIFILCHTPVLYVLLTGNTLTIIVFYNSFVLIEVLK